VVKLWRKRRKEHAIRRGEKMTYHIYSGNLKGYNHLRGANVVNI
jgi:hypothetical protein